MADEKYFKDRIDAGRQLAKELKKYAERDDVIVLALPRGGLPIGYEIAKKLKVPLDVIVARKIGAPHNPEFGIGAVTEGGMAVVNIDAVRVLGVSKDELNQLATEEANEVERRRKLFRGDRPELQIEGKTVILVDDGLAAGATALAAIRYLRSKNPKQIVFAVPVCPKDTADYLRKEVDDLICPNIPDHFTAVGVWYDNFPQLSDEDALAILRQAQTKGGAS
jgi:predicted phosphoribosyltransferase